MTDVQKKIANTKDCLSRLNFNVTILPIVIFVAMSLLGQMLRTTATPCGLIDQCSQANLQMNITH